MLLEFVSAIRKYTFRRHCCRTLMYMPRVGDKLKRVRDVCALNVKECFRVEIDYILLSSTRVLVLLS